HGARGHGAHNACGPDEIDPGEAACLYSALRTEHAMTTKRKAVAALGLVATLALSLPLFAQQLNSFESSLAKPGRASASRSGYFPERFEWERRRPDQLGMKATLVDEAMQVAIAAETPGPKDMTAFLQRSFGREPNYTIVGPIMDRGPASGLIVYKGFIV